MQSSNGVEDNIAKIAMLFPDCVTETIDEVSGQPKHLVDFEKLKQNLSDSVMSEKAGINCILWAKCLGKFEYICYFCRRNYS